MDCSRKVFIAMTATAALSLGGCLAAAVPIMLATTAAGTAFSGFAIYKAVQTSTGGRVRVAFGTGVEGEVPPADPLPMARRVAVWPGDEMQVKFAERMEASGRYEVVTPGAVARTLAARQIPVILAQLTTEEKRQSMLTVCREHRADLIFAAQGEGVSTNANMFSFGRGTMTDNYGLTAFDCRSEQFAWREKMAIVQEVGSTTTPAGEVATIAGEAWAERILEAPNG